MTFQVHSCLWCGILAPLWLRCQDTYIDIITGLCPPPTLFRTISVTKLRRVMGLLAPKDPINGDPACIFRFIGCKMPTTPINVEGGR